MKRASNFYYKKINHPEYKYELLADHTIWLDLKPTQELHNKFFSIYTTGRLVIRKGYRWDGASGPTWDTKSVIYASLIHDVLYQMFRENQLNRYTWKDQADRELQRIMIECGDSDWPLWNKFRASYYYNAVKYFGHTASGGKFSDVFEIDKFKNAL